MTTQNFEIIKHQDTITKFAAFYLFGVCDLSGACFLIIDY